MSLKEQDRQLRTFYHLSRPPVPRLKSPAACIIIPREIALLQAAR